VNEPAVQVGEGLQAWLQASSEAVLQQQLVELFATHRPSVIEGKQDVLATCLAAIKTWLAASNDWLLVFEDASPASATLWNLLPADTGRVLITSQAPLHEDHVEFDGIQLDEISIGNSINLLLKSKIFMNKKKKVNAADPPLADDALRKRCAEEGVDFFISPPLEEDSSSVKRRQNMTEFLRPEFVTFLKEDLGNDNGCLPLSVSMVGQMIRSDTNIKTTLDLIGLFKKVQLGTAWETKARNNMTDKHYFGLARSVQITLNRMESDENFTLGKRREAKALLYALSRLDGTKTPVDLLMQNKTDDLINRNCPDGKSFDPQAYGLSVFDAAYIINPAGNGPGQLGGVRNGETLANLTSHPLPLSHY
jgi:hypothetical protein